MAKPILVVDDDETLRETITEVLEDAGYRVEIFTNGQHALHWLRSGKEAGVILLDLMLDEMDGFEFRTIQLADVGLAQIPVVLVTGTHDIEAIAASLRITDYLKKPFAISQLLEVVGKYVDVAPQQTL